MRAARRFTGLLIALAAMLILVAPAPASAAVGQVGAVRYSSSGDLIAGWGWLRGTGDTAAWTFTTASLGSFKSNTVHLNVTALVTNRTSGGSGYSASGVVFRVSSGRVSQVLTMSLINPFRPQDPTNSRGVGYFAYGSSVGVLKPALFTTGRPVLITVSYPFPNSRHIAFKRSSLTLGFKR